MGRSHCRALALACLCALLTGTVALYTDKDSVVELTSSNFQKQVVQYDGVALVEFYAPWCGHCQAMAPHYKKVADKLKGIALVGSVDCDVESNKKLCAQFQIRSFPTIKVFPAQQQKNPYTGELTKLPEDYLDGRTAKPMLKAVEGALTDLHVTTLKSPADLQAFRQQHASKPQVLLFSSKEKSTMLYNGLSTQLHRGLAFALVHESATGIVEAEGVSSFPTLKVIKPDGEVEVYSGEMNGASLKQFLDTFMPDTLPDPVAEEPAAQQAPPPAPVKVANLTVGGLAEVDAQEEMWLVAFVKATAEECQEHIARYLEVVRDLEGVVNLGVVRATAEDLPQLPDSYGVDKAALEAAPCEPQLVLFPFGSDKQDLEEYQKYQGAMDAKEVQKWVLAAAPDFVQEVTGATYATFMGAQQAPGSPQAPGIKVFLFTNKAEAPPLFRALAAAFRGKASFQFGFMNMQQEDVKQMVQIPQVPLVALAVPMLRDGKVQMATEPFRGAMRLKPLYAWLREMAERLQVLTDGTQSAGPTTESLVPAVSTNELLQQHCATKAGLCVLALLDAASPAYSTHLGTITRIAAARIEQPLHFIQMDGPTQPALLQQLGVLRSDIPTVVALSPKKLRYAVLQDTFSDTAVDALLDDLLSGRARTSVLEELPKLVDGGVAPGSAGPTEGEAPAGAEEEPLAEEEFDLSDILGEEVEGDLGAAADKLAQVDQELQEEAKQKAEEAAKKAEEAKKSKAKKKKSKKAKKSKKKAKKADAAAGQGDIQDDEL